MNTAMILAGGTGSRVGADRPKQFIEILGKPILAYTCEIFQNNSRIDKIVIVCHKDWVDYCRDTVEKYDLSKVTKIVLGGVTFQDSVISGLNYIKEFVCSDWDNEYVFIQYGAAPFTSQKIVDAVINMTYEKGSAVTGTPCYQLMATKDGEDKSLNWVNRDDYIQIACPYGFKLSYLDEIYNRAKAEGLLEKIEPHTTSLMFALGEAVNFAYGDQTNIKITTSADVTLFKCYVKGLFVYTGGQLGDSLLG